jgi:hypothetical protein
MPDVFVEINPYHAVTLYYYHANCTGGADDVVFGNQRLFGQGMFDEIPARKVEFSLFRFVRHLWRHRVNWCHVNTINLVLYPLNKETLRLNLTTLFLPLIARLFRCRTSAIIHEADQFYATDLDSPRRTTLFRRIIGRRFIRLLDRRYVLSNEVAGYLRERNIPIELLEARPLSRFAASRAGSATGRAGQTVLCWIGPVVSNRRSCRELLELDPELLQDLDVTIVIVGDIRTEEGPAFKTAVGARGLSGHFVFFPYRPDDYELVSWVRRSAGVLCLYSSPEYGKTKNSGARLIAAAFDKPFIATSPSLGVYRPDGQQLAACDSLEDCIRHIAEPSRCTMNADSAQEVPV